MQSFKTLKKHYLNNHIKVHEIEQITIGLNKYLQRKKERIKEWKEKKRERMEKRREI